MSEVVNITFSLYSTQQGGEPLWTETQNNVQLDPSGHYSVMLGVIKQNGVPTARFTSAEARWLGVKIGEQAEQPRVLLLSVPYALKAGDAETLGGRPASAYALAGAPVVLAPGPTESSTVTGSATAYGSASEVQPMTTTCASVTSDGTAVVNALAKFTTPCNVEGSAISENGGRVGIGGAGVSGAKLALTDTQTNFGLKWLQHSVFDTTATVNGSTNYGLALDADASNMTIPAGVTDKGYRLGVYGRGFAYNTGFAGTLAQQFGVNGSAGILSGKSGAKVESAYGGYYEIYNNVPGTTITNAYGLYISNSQTSGTITNRYDLYASSANAKNYFAGTLEVNGTTKFDNLVSFAGGQTFPGTGTITGITAGTDLTGGGTSGNVTLNLDTTKVPQLSASNTFTVGQTIEGASSFSGTNESGPMLSVSNSGDSFSSAITATNSGQYGIGISASAAADGDGIEGYGTQTAGSIGVLGALANSNGFSNSFFLLESDDGLDSGVWADGANGQEAALIATSDDLSAGIFFNDSSASSTILVLNNFSGGPTGNATQGFGTVLRAEGPGGACGINQTGSIACTGQVKTLAATQNGTRQVETYSVQSAENWLEDYGSGQLNHGGVTINLDPIFADTVNTGVDFHVFLTPGGDCKGLYVANKTARSFEVHELGGGTTSIPFDYKIVAKRRGHETERLVDVTERMQSEANAARFKRLAKSLPRRTMTRNAPTASTAKTGSASTRQSVGPQAVPNTPTVLRPLLRSQRQ